MKQYIVILCGLLFFKDSLAMITRPTTTRTLYQPTPTRVWEGMETTQASPTSYKEPRYFSTSTVPRTLFTQPSTQPAIQRAAFARWQQQIPRTLLQQPSTSTRVFETQRPFAQPIARTYTYPRQSWWNWLQSWWRKLAHPGSYNEIYKMDKVITDIQQNPKENEVLREFFHTLDPFPKRFINDVYTLDGLQSDQGKYEFDGLKFIDPILSNKTLLKIAIVKLKDVERKAQTQFLQEMIHFGADPNYNPHYTTPEALIMIKTSPDYEKYQYPPIWIAIMESNAPALKVLLQAGVKITNKTAEQVSNITDGPYSQLTLLEIAKNINNKQILDILTEFDYISKPKEETYQEPPQHQQAQPQSKQLTPLSNAELAKLGLNKMYEYVSSFDVKTDPYAILGIKPSDTWTTSLKAYFGIKPKKLSKNEIDTSWKTLVRAYFSDKFTDPEDNRKANFIQQKINPAHDEILIRENLNID